MSVEKNGEGYYDPTAGTALHNIYREERHIIISRLISVMKGEAELAGFEVVGRIILKDKTTGKEYR